MSSLDGSDHDGDAAAAENLAANGGGDFGSPGVSPIRSGGGSANYSPSNGSPSNIARERPQIQNPQIYLATVMEFLSELRFHLFQDVSTVGLFIKILQSALFGNRKR